MLQKKKKIVGSSPLPWQADKADFPNKIACRRASYRNTVSRGKLKEGNPHS